MSNYFETLPEISADAEKQFDKIFEQFGITNNNFPISYSHLRKFDFENVIFQLVYYDEALKQSIDFGLAPTDLKDLVKCLINWGKQLDISDIVNDYTDNNTGLLSQVKRYRVENAAFLIKEHIISFGNAIQKWYSQYFEGEK